MNAKRRNELLFELVQNYVLDKKKNKVFARENDSSMTYSRGVLVGACMAFDCELIEAKSCLKITTRKGKELVHYPLD